MKSSYFLIIPQIIVVLGLASCDTKKSLGPIQDQTFIKLYGGPNNQIGYDLVSTEDGGFLLAGSSFSVNDPNESDVFIIKTDQAGNEISSLYIDINGSNDVARSIIHANDGGYIVVGTSTYTDGTTDAFLAKINEAGNQVVWKQPYGNIQTSEDAWSLTPTIEKDGYILVGTSNELDIAKYAPSDIPEITDVSDAYWVRVQENGSVIWAKRHGWIGVDSAKSIIPLADQSGYAIAGTSDSLQIGEAESDLNVLVYFINRDGNPMNAALYGTGTMDESAMDIAQTSSGSFVVTGRKTDENGQSDIYLMGLNSYLGLEILWEKEIGKDEQDIGYSIALQENENILISGTTASFGEGGRDFFLMETDPSGNENWFQTFGWAGDDIGGQVIRTTDNRLVTIGTTNFGTNTMVSLIKTDKNGELEP